jgi:hypothetical protein
MTTSKGGGFLSVIKNGPRAGTISQLIEQEAYAYTYDQNGNRHAYPSRIVMNLEQGQQPYPAGFYLLSPSSFYVNRFNQLELGRPQLVPMERTKAASVQAAA